MRGPDCRPSVTVGSEGRLPIGLTDARPSQALIEPCRMHRINTWMPHAALLCGRPGARRRTGAGATRTAPACRRACWPCAARYMRRAACGCAGAPHALALYAGSGLPFCACSLPLLAQGRSDGSAALQCLQQSACSWYAPYTLLRGMICERRCEHAQAGRAAGLLEGCGAVVGDGQQPQARARSHPHPTLDPGCLCAAVWRSKRAAGR